MKTNGYSITLRTQAQVQAYKNEFMGQFSDGYWENSRVQNWRLWTNLEVKVDPENNINNVNCTIPSYELHYNIEEMQLQNIVGYRIIAPMRVINTLGLFNLSDEVYSSLFDICDRFIFTKNSDKSKYYTADEVLTPSKVKEDIENASYSPRYKEYLKNMIEGLEKTIKLEDIYNALCDFKTYTNRNYNKDLREMKKAMMTRVDIKS